MGYPWASRWSTFLVMAAWVMAGVVWGVACGVVIGLWLGQREARMLEEARRAMAATAKPRDGDGELLERVLGRLLDATVPERREESAAASPTTTHEAEYEEPVEEVGDWTDPFIGLERPLVARLAPGQQIAPGLPREDVEGGGTDPIEAWRESGEAAFDEWMVDGAMEGTWKMPVEGWVEPVRLDNE